MSLTINISPVKVSDIRSSSISSSSFENGDTRTIEIWDGFKLENLLDKIINIMEEKEENFNSYRIFVYTKEAKQFNDFDILLNNGDYFNVAIIEDDDDEEEYEEEEEDEEEKYDEATKEDLKKRKEKFLELLRQNTEESLRGMEIYRKTMSRAVVEPVYRDGVRVGTTFSVESIRIDEEIEAQLKEMGLGL